MISILAACYTALIICFIVVVIITALPEVMARFRARKFERFSVYSLDTMFKTLEGELITSFRSSRNKYYVEFGENKGYVFTLIEGYAE